MPSQNTLPSDDDPGQPRAVLHVHEEQHDERGLEDRDGQRRDRVERPEIEEGDPAPSGRCRPSGREDRVVDARGNDVCRCSMHVPPDQVEQRKQENPHDVDEVPVEAADLDRAVVLGGDRAAPGQPDITP